MRALTNYLPWRKQQETSPALSTDQWLDRWFHEPTWPDLVERGWTVPYEVEENDDEYLMKVEVPGWDAKDLDVEVSANRVAIRGKHTDESGDDRKSAWARRHAELSLQLELPAEVDSTKASGEVKNGVLTIRLPKTEQARQRTRKIALHS
jgi:HSP20 family protein